MLSYKEYRRLKESRNNKKEVTFEDIDSLFKSWTSEVTGLIISPKYADNLIYFCENAANSGSKWKTIQEHRMIKQLPAIIYGTLEEECAQARLFINEAKYQIKTVLKEAEAAADPWAQLQNRNAQAAKDIEKEVEAIFYRLKNDFLHQYGFNRGQGEQPNIGGSGHVPYAPQKPGLWGRAKNWLKGVWQGATGGDPNLRKFALSKGYAADPNYRNDPHAWKDKSRFPDQFQGESQFLELQNLLKEDFEDARTKFHDLFNKHKKDLLNLIAKYVLQNFGSSEEEPIDRTTPNPVVQPPPQPVSQPVPAAEEESEDNQEMTPAEIGAKPKTGKPVKWGSFGPNKLEKAIRNRKPDGSMELETDEGKFNVKEVERNKRHVSLAGDGIKVKVTAKRWDAAEKAASQPESQPEPVKTPEPIKEPESQPTKEPWDDDEPETSPEELASVKTDPTHPDYIPDPDDEEDEPPPIIDDEALGIDDSDKIPSTQKSAEDLASSGDDQSGDPTEKWMAAVEKARAAGKPEPEYREDGIYDDDDNSDNSEKDKAIPEEKPKPEKAKATHIKDSSSEERNEMVKSLAGRSTAFTKGNLKNLSEDRTKFTYNRKEYDVVFHQGKNNIWMIGKNGKKIIGKRVPVDIYEDKIKPFVGKLTQAEEKKEKIPHIRATDTQKDIDQKKELAAAEDEFNAAFGDL